MQDRCAACRQSWAPPLPALAVAAAAGVDGAAADVAGGGAVVGAGALVAAGGAAAGPVQATTMAAPAAGISSLSAARRDISPFMV